MARQGPFTLLAFAALLAGCTASSAPPGGSGAGDGGPGSVVVEPDAGAGRLPDGGPGCATALGCASELCLPSADCVNCMSDAECSARKRCMAGTCAEPCDGTCEGGLSCCEGVCLDLSQSVLACGACGEVCGAEALCTGASCVAMQFASVCAMPRIRIALDGLPGDDEVSAALAADLAARCGATVTRVPSADSGFFDPRGTPTEAGGVLYAAAGGPFAQPLVNQLEGGLLTQVYSAGNVEHAVFLSYAGQVIVDAPRSALTASHDYFVVELVREPVNGAGAAVAYGFAVPGTRAAAWYLGHVLIASGSSRTWVVGEWTDGDGDQVPDEADTFRILEQGP